MKNRKSKCGSGDLKVYLTWSAYARAHTSHFFTAWVTISFISKRRMKVITSEPVFEQEADCAWFERMPVGTKIGRKENLISILTA